MSGAEPLWGGRDFRRLTGIRAWDTASPPADLWATGCRLAGRASALFLHACTRCEIRCASFLLPCSGWEGDCGRFLIP